MENENKEQLLKNQTKRIKQLRRVKGVTQEEALMILEYSSQELSRASVMFSFPPSNSSVDTLEFPWVIF
ncbi:hypothetical protein [Flagellimonas sp.]|uniref:hypothetical protein n=1 Tax=Flagellimonas sp. TaxID=2058762 RepID=UPI003B5B4EFA